MSLTIITNGATISSKKVPTKSRGRPRTATQVPQDFPIKLIPTPEASENFRRRKDEVQRMIVEILLRSRRHKSDEK